MQRRNINNRSITEIEEQLIFLHRSFVARRRNNQKNEAFLVVWCTSTYMLLFMTKTDSTQNPSCLTARLLFILLSLCFHIYIPPIRSTDRVSRSHIQIASAKRFFCCRLCRLSLASRSSILIIYYYEKYLEITWDRGRGVLAGCPRQRAQ